MNILIVDDSQEWINSHLSMLVQLYPDMKQEPDIAMSAREGLTKVVASNKTYDIIISDMEMETVFEECYAGEWLIKRLKQCSECKNSKIIVVSGAYDIEDIAKRLDVDYIPKSSLLSNPLLFKYKIDEL